MNMLEKILAKRSGRKKVAPGAVVVCEVDCALLHDLSARSCRVVFEKQVGGKLAHPLLNATMGRYSSDRAR